jgi:hypothetical protein
MSLSPVKVLVWGARDRRFKSSHPDKEMKKVIIGVVIFCALAVITNPSEKKHKEAVKKELNALLEEEIGVLGEFLSRDFKLKRKALSTLIHRENNYIYSKTTLKMLGEERVIGYGFFGFVIINRDALH